MQTFIWQSSVIKTIYHFKGGMIKANKQTQQRHKMWTRVVTTISTFYKLRLSSRQTVLVTTVSQ